MAFRPSQFLIDGELDNTVLGTVIGELCFAGLAEKIRLDLRGDFHRDIRGAKILLLGDPNATERADQSRYYFRKIARVQTGHVGDITAGLPPYDYVRYPYIEWYSEQNGRVVLEYEPERVRVVGKPIPYQETDPISREQQARNREEFLKRRMDELLKNEPYGKAENGDDPR